MARLPSSPDSRWSATRRISPAPPLQAAILFAHQGAKVVVSDLTAAKSEVSRLLSTAAVHPNHPQPPPLVATASHPPLPPSPTLLQSTADFIRNSCCTALSVPGDVTDPAFPARLVAAAVRAYGALHILVCNAG